MKPKKKITKKQLREVYRKPIDPLQPFERLHILMEYGIQELKKLKPFDVTYAVTFEPEKGGSAPSNPDAGSLKMGKHQPDVSEENYYQ